ncbi:hypothetical protein D3C87_877680 [compost metagenome]
MECIGQEDPVSYDEIDEENVFTIIENGRVYCYTKDTIMRLYQSQGTLRNPLTNVPLSPEMKFKVENFVNGKDIVLNFVTYFGNYSKGYSRFDKIGDVINDYFRIIVTNEMNDEISLYKYDMNDEIGSIFQGNINPRFEVNGKAIKGHVVLPIDNLVTVSSGHASLQDVNRLRRYNNEPTYFIPLPTEEKLVYDLMQILKYDESERNRIIQTIVNNLIISASTANDLALFAFDPIVHGAILQAVADPWDLDIDMDGSLSWFPGHIISWDINNPPYPPNNGIHPRTGMKIPIPNIEYQIENNTITIATPETGITIMRYE